MSNKAFQQNLDDKKGPQPGGPYLIQMQPSMVCCPSIT